MDPLHTHQTVQLCSVFDMDEEKKLWTYNQHTKAAANTKSGGVFSALWGGTVKNDKPSSGNSEAAAQQTAEVDMKEYMEKNGYASIGGLATVAFKSQGSCPVSQCLEKEVAGGKKTNSPAEPNSNSKGWFGPNGGWFGSTYRQPAVQPKHMGKKSQKAIEEEQRQQQEKDVASSSSHSTAVLTLSSILPRVQSDVKNATSNTKNKSTEQSLQRKQAGTPPPVSTTIHSATSSSVSAEKNTANASPSRNCHNDMVHISDAQHRFFIASNSTSSVCKYLPPMPLRPPLRQEGGGKGKEKDGKIVESENLEPFFSPPRNQQATVPLDSSASGVTHRIYQVRPAAANIQFDIEPYYEGEKKGQIFHGYGTYYYRNGDRYVGQWKNHKRHGQGVYYHFNGGKYTGSYVDDQQHGWGTYYYTPLKKGDPLDRYEGEYKNGKQEGRGTYWHASGSRYEGTWKGGKQDGFGKYFYESGGSYEGEYRNGLQHGKGCYVSPEGVVYRDEYDNGKLVKEERIVAPRNG